MRKTIKTLALTMIVLIASTASHASTRVQQLALDGHDGNRITGFIYQERETEKDAPLAILMHGLTGSSLYWLAEDTIFRGSELTAMLIDRGYRVVALDARSHGARKDDIKPFDRVIAARKGETGAYKDMIEQTILDYNTLYQHVLKNFEKPRHVLVVGYSMGGQMGVLYTAQSESATYLVTMVPPAVRNVPEVSPIAHAEKISVPWLLLTADKDDFSTIEQNNQLAEIAMGTVSHISFDSGHLLPREWISTVGEWISKTIDPDSSQ